MSGTGVPWLWNRGPNTLKRNPNTLAAGNEDSVSRERTKTASGALDRQGRGSRSHHHGRSARKFLLFPCRGRSLFYLLVLSAVFAFALISMVLQSSIMSVFGQGSERDRLLRDGFKFGTTLKFVPAKMRQRFELRSGLDRRGQSTIGVRSPRLAIVLGSIKENPLSLMLFTVAKSLQRLGYILKIYAIEDGEARSTWESIVGQVSVLGPEELGHVDWTRFEGVIVDSLDAKDAISSLMQEPFCSVPLVWIIQDDTLANRLPVYAETGHNHITSYWRKAFHRADAVVFPDFSLPMLHSVLDTGNFFVIPGSPIDVWAAESFIGVHSRSKLRQENHFSDDDILVVVVGSSFFYNDISWDYAVSMNNIEPLLMNYARGDDKGAAFKFLFLCGNSTGYENALQAITTRMGLRPGSISHYSLNEDVNGMLLMSDIVIYGSSQDEQGFPPLLMRAMTFGIPVIAPNYSVIKKYVVDGVHGMIFPRDEPEGLMRAFSPLISKWMLSKYARKIGSSGKMLVKNMLASECVAGYAKLLENVLAFPSDARIPRQISELNQVWEWGLFRIVEHRAGMDQKGIYLSTSSVVNDLEENLSNPVLSKNDSQSESDTLVEDIPTEREWDIFTEMESSEEAETVEMEEIDERMEKNIGEWDEIYHSARKAEKIKFELNERDEGELERTGQSLCIYEIYDGAGAWPFLHHGSLYRGLSLSTNARRLRSDDVDAVDRLTILNVTYYRDILCEIGGMFAVANRVDNIHKRPWIGFQSWRATGRKVSLSATAEQVLDNTLHEKTKGDVIYFWARLNFDGGLVGNSDVLTFWSICDSLNGGNCRTAFKDAFRRMYGLPSHVEALPPMPEDGGQWSALHSWVMPTPSFLEFIMFSRMFVNGLDQMDTNSLKKPKCLFGFSILEKKHCYCRVLELLVNVWAYHSGRKMVYLNPSSGILEEQHPVELRKGFMWAKYFNSSLLKSMDEDLAESADDGEHQSDDDMVWLWPLTGEVYWQGIYEREREERYRLKMEKKRRTREKLLERMQHGYKQKTLGL